MFHVEFSFVNMEKRVQWNNLESVEVHKYTHTHTAGHTMHIFKMCNSLNSLNVLLGEYKETIKM